MRLLVRTINDDDDDNFDFQGINNNFILILNELIIIYFLLFL